MLRETKKSHLRLESSRNQQETVREYLIKNRARRTDKEDGIKRGDRWEEGHFPSNDSLIVVSNKLKNLKQRYLDGIVLRKNLLMSDKELPLKLFLELIFGRRESSLIMSSLIRQGKIKLKTIKS